MSWIISITSSVEKQLRRIPRKAYIRIRVAIDLLEFDPWSGDIVKLGGAQNAWRRRVGEYRFKYRIFTAEHSVQIYEIERRTSKTY